MKKKIAVSIDSELYEWLLEEVEKKEFGSVSHGINKALTKLREENEKARLQYDREPHLEYDTRKKQGKT